MDKPASHKTKAFKKIAKATYTKKKGAKAAKARAKGGTKLSSNAAVNKQLRELAGY